MTAEPRTIRTEAEKTILDTFDRVGGGLPGGKLVTARRAAAFDLFRKTDCRTGASRNGNTPTSAR